MKRIAVGIDFSQPSDVALSHAMGLARRWNGSLVLLHVYSPVASAYAGAAAHRVHNVLTEQLDAARQLLNRKREEVVAAGIPATSQLIAGDPKRGLAGAAGDAQASLLVVGSHGHTGLKRFIMGSVAELAVRLSEIDTLVARSPDGGSYARVLVPVDFTERSDAAMELAVRMADHRGAIDVMHAIEPPVYVASADAMGLAMSAVESEAGKQGASVLERFRQRFPETSFSLVRDTAATAISKRLENADYDLVVLGSHGRTGVARWVLGSVAEATVRHAPCSVLVAKSEVDVD